MPKARPYDTDTPLDRVVDALPPESLGARSLAALVRAEGEGDSGARAQLREMCGVWRALPAHAGPAELEAPAQRLRELGEMVEGILDGTLPIDQARDQVSRAALPMGEYLLAPVPVLAGWLQRRAGVDGQDG
jgi:hypothetical protein